MVLPYWYNTVANLVLVGEGSGNNYAYLVTDDKTKDAVIIDPANPPEYVGVLFDVANAYINCSLRVLPTLKKATESGAKLKSIINTHQSVSEIMTA